MHLAQKLVGILFFACVVFLCEAQAQTHLYTTYTKADGLPSDYVLRIYQSPGGFMWFGTERGAAIYNGERFTTYTTDNGLPHNLVYDILEDAQGRTWFATPIPTLAFLKQGRIHILRDSSGSRQPIFTLAIDRNSRVFFRHQDGIGVLNGDNYEFHAVPMSVSKESNYEHLFDGRVAMSDARHILATRLDSGTDLRFDTLFTMDQVNAYTVIKQAPDSSIFITHTKGVSRLRFDGDRLIVTESYPIGFYTTLSVIGNFHPYKVLLGNRTDGLSLLNNGTLSPLTTSYGSNRGFISHHYVDYEGNVWIGFFGQGVEKLTTSNALVYNEESGLAERNVWRVATHRNEPLAMGVAGIQRIRQNKAEPIDDLHSSLRAVRGIQYAKDRVYISTIFDLRVMEYDSNRDVIGKLIDIHGMRDGVNDIRLASDGSVWVACAGMQLFRLMPDETVVSYPMKNGAEKLVRSGDAMWILTSTDGAFRFENDVFRQYSKANGELPSNAVWSVHEDDHGILIGTSSGLTAIAPNGTRTQFNASNGLNGLPVIGLFPTQSSEVKVPSYWVVTPNQLHQLSNGILLKGNSLATLSKEMASTYWVEPSNDLSNMYLGTSSGLVIYDLTQAGRDIPPPKVYIHGVMIEAEHFNGQMEGDIRHTSSSSTLEFEFAGLTFIKEDDTKFTYRLVGVDKEWSTPQSNRTVRYANVSPGEYEFQVRAINIDGQASANFASLRVFIDPPLWMHPWVLGVMVVAFGIALVGGIRWRVQNIRAEIIQRNEQKQFEAIQRIGASISHDIKNTVFSLSLLSKNLEKRFNNPEFRKDAIETIESSLTYLSTLVNRLQEAPTQVDVAQHNVQLLSLCTDVGKRVTGGSGRYVELDMSESIRIRVNPEPIERILENLIRNAIEATSSTQSVRVSAHQSRNETEILVIDQGMGMSDDFLRNRIFKPFQSTKTKGLGIGLYSCKELVDAMGGSIQVDSVLGKGTTFRLRFVTSAT